MNTLTPLSSTIWGGESFPFQKILRGWIPPIHWRLTPMTTSNFSFRGGSPFPPSQKIKFGRNLGISDRMSDYIFDVKQWWCHEFTSYSQKYECAPLFNRWPQHLYSTRKRVGSETVRTVLAATDVKKTAQFRCTDHTVSECARKKIKGNQNKMQ